MFFFVPRSRRLLGDRPELIYISSLFVFFANVEARMIRGLASAKPPGEMSAGGQRAGGAENGAGREVEEDGKKKGEAGGLRGGRSIAEESGGERREWRRWKRQGGWRRARAGGWRISSGRDKEDGAQI